MSEITVSEVVLDVQLTSDMGPPGPKGDTGAQGPPGESVLDLTEHIAAEIPHPIYDDGASFLLLYENAKV